MHGTFTTTMLTQLYARVGMLTQLYERVGMLTKLCARVGNALLTQ
jgi:hypothetical protein